MRTHIVIDPLTRIEGHLKLEADVENRRVVDARSSGTLYRGFEEILVGRNPLDAIQITQRFCGVCPTPHGIASSQALENAFGIMPPTNGRIIRNIMQGANYLQSHILHFYQLALLDYFRGPDVPPFVPRYESDYRVPPKIQEDLLNHYVQAYHIRLKAHELCAIWSGKMPHMACLAPGGVTIRPRIDNITTSLWRLKELTEFVDTVFMPDVLTIAEVYRDYLQVGKGCGNYLSFGLFDLDDEPDVMKRKRLFTMGRCTDGELHDVDPEEITEDVKYSWYDSPSNAYPGDGTTHSQPGKEGAYSWLKAPRYDGKAHEVGALARLMIAYKKKEPRRMVELLDGVLARLQAEPEDLCSVLGRHIARVLECKLICEELSGMIMAVKLDEPVCTPHTIPESASGIGLWDAARGALGHWITIERGKIARYQAVVPTTWNACPKDDKGEMGPVEMAMMGTEIDDPENPFELARIVRSFDPCIACAVHCLEAGETVSAIRVA